MRKSRLLKAEIIVLVCVAALWAVNLKTRCVSRATAGALRQVIKVTPNNRIDGVQDTADKSLTKAAEQGDVEAQYMLGWMYCAAQDAQKDFEIAEKWLAKAARQGHADSQFLLGLLYIEIGLQFEIGQRYDQFHGISRDCTENDKRLTHATQVGRKWIKKAADQGHTEAQCLWIELYMMPDEVLGDAILNSRAK